MSKRITVGIAGLGLIGGSIAKALKRTGKPYRMVAWNRCTDSVSQAMADEVVHSAVSSDFHEFSECDIIFLCVPVYAMAELIQKLKPVIRPDCLLTDVGSTKGDVEKIAKDMGVWHQFIGGHPMAGSEKTGYAAAKANLFENAYYIMTMNPQNPVDGSVLEEIIQDLRAIPVIMDADKHDAATAVISHVPHVVASLLVNLVDKLDGPQGYMKTLAAGGFKDITRIASSSPELWTGISISNQKAILDTLSEMKQLLGTFEADLEHNHQKGLQDYFSNARTVRNGFSDLNKGILQKTYDIVVDVDDKPGIIAAIATAFAQQNINIKNIGINNSREEDEGALEIRFENEESRTRGLDTLLELGYQAKSRK